MPNFFASSFFNMPVQEEFEKWFLQSDQAAFGHARLPEESPMDRIQHLVGDAISLVPDGHSIIYVVADRIERRLLMDELPSNKPHFMATMGKRLLISDYATFYTALRRQSAWRDWKVPHITVICNVDLHYSAAFALCMIFFMRWAQRPSGTSRLRLLTLSDSVDVEQPLWRCLREMLPSTQNFAVVLLSPVKQTRATLVAYNPWLEKEDFVETVVRHVAYNVKKSHSSIIVCSATQYDQIQDKLKANLGSCTKFRCVSNMESSVDDIFWCCRPRISPNLPHDPPTVIGIVSTNHVPLQLERVSCIFIGDESHRANWEMGRLIYDSAPRSLREVKQAMSYVYQSSLPQVMIRHPVIKNLPIDPARKLENSEMLGFIANLAMLVGGDHDRLVRIASCFVKDEARYHTTLLQLDAMGFLKHRQAPNGIQSYFPQMKAAEHVERLLPLLNYDFAATWFLAHGLDDDQASESTKRAMAYIAAIVATESAAQGRPAVFRKEDMCMALDHAVDMIKSGMQKNIEHELHGHFRSWVSFPEHLWLQGGIWAQVAFAHALYSLDPDMNKVNTELSKFDLPPHDNVRTLRSTVQVVVKRLKRIDAKLNLQLLQDKSLDLTAQDCSRIQLSMGLAWRHCSVLLFPDQERGGYQILDLVTMTSTGIGQDPDDPFRLSLALSTPGVYNGNMVLAVRHMERKHVVQSILIRDTVVLPSSVLQDVKKFFKSVALDRFVPSATGPLAHLLPRIHEWAVLEACRRARSRNELQAVEGAAAGPVVLHNADAQFEQEDTDGDVALSGMEDHFE